MLNKLRGFSNTKLAGVLVAIIIVPFVFWGMGSVFSGGNTNNIAKIISEKLDITLDVNILFPKTGLPLDIPDPSFNGPF